MNFSLRKTGYALLLLTMVLGLGCFAYLRPSYVANQTYLGALIVIEALIGAIWMYKRAFFPVVLLAFLLAGVDLPLASVWTSARWLFLGIGAFVGCLMLLATRKVHFGFFHLIAFSGVVLSAMSAFSSAFPWVTLAKALSLLFLFVYAATGLRMAVIGREQSFFMGLLLGSEIFVTLLAISYAVGREIMGNPNSLGAVAGILAPILLWGALLGGETFVRHRRSLLYCVCMYLAVQSQARAGWFAALMSCGLLCLALRKYRLMMVGAILVVSMVATAGILAPLTLSSVTNFAIFKGGNKDEGLFASRKGPWQTALDNIQQHPWLGMGLGTTMNAVDPNVQQGLYASSSDVTAENGSSYLAILAGLGIVGAIPMFLLLILLVRKILQTTTWLRTFNSPWHPAVPSAMIVVAGLVHASFEDWLFAPGNYLCIFFWSAAFLLIDLAPREFNVFSRRNLR